MAVEKIGNEVCVDFYGCDKEKLNNMDFIRETLQKAVSKSQLKSLDLRLYKFNPHGITGYAVLMTSHIAIHTYPEFNYASIDIFACDAVWKLEKAYRIFKEALNPKRVRKLVFRRGKKFKILK